MRSNDSGLLRVIVAATGALSLAVMMGQPGVAQGPLSRITGRVVDGTSGAPAANANVFASTPEQTQSHRTGPTGDFAFTFVKPVRVRLWADKAGYLRAYAGQLGPMDSAGEGSTIDIPLGTTVDRVLLRLWSSAAIGGTISSGTEAVVGATVAVLRREFRGDGFAWARVPLKRAQSDDRGKYRIAGLEPGSYMVAVLGESRPARGTSPFPTFAPGVQVAAAATIFKLAGGAEVTADVQLETNETTTSVAGRVLNGDRPAANVTVRLRRLTVSDETATDFDEIECVTDASGGFRFSEVSAGAYKLRALQFPKSDYPLLNLAGSFQGYAFGGGRMDNAEVAVGDAVPRLPAGPTLYGDAFVDSRSSDAVLIRLQPAASISGRVLFQDGSPPQREDLPKIPMLIRPADGSDLGGIPQTRIEPDGAFRSPGLPPGGYVIVPLVSRARLSDTWTTVALTSGGIDSLGGVVKLDTTDLTDVLVTLSTKPAEVSGKVTRPSASSALAARVIIFPKSDRLRSFYYAFPSPRRVTQAPVSSSGTFRAALPPGEYLAAAIVDELPEFWMTAGVLARLSPWATQIHLGVGDRVTVNLEARFIAFAK